MIVNNARISCGWAVFDVSASEVSHCLSFLRWFNFWKTSRLVARTWPFTVLNFLKDNGPRALINSDRKLRYSKLLEWAVYSKRPTALVEYKLWCPSFDFLYLRRRNFFGNALHMQCISTSEWWNVFVNILFLHNGKNTISVVGEGDNIFTCIFYCKIGSNKDWRPGWQNPNIWERGEEEKELLEIW